MPDLVLSSHLPWWKQLTWWVIDSEWFQCQACCRRIGIEVRTLQNTSSGFVLLSNLHVDVHKLLFRSVVKNLGSIWSWANSFFTWRLSDLMRRAVLFWSALIWIRAQLALEFISLHLWHTIPQSMSSLCSELMVDTLKAQCCLTCAALGISAWALGSVLMAEYFRGNGKNSENRVSSWSLVPYFPPPGGQVGDVQTWCCRACLSRACCPPIPFSKSRPFVSA